MTSKIGILYGRKDHWSEEPQGGVYEKDKRGYYNDHKYEGEIENGKPNGNGTWEMGNGATYVGQWVNGLREGFGTFTWSKYGPLSGKVYEGEWKDNSPNGKGKIYYERGGDKKFEGMSWEGEFKDGKDWNVTIYLKDRSIYGEYKDGEIVDDESWREGKDYTEEELQKRVDEIEKREKEYEHYRER
jgi:hypothetical protein